VATTQRRAAFMRGEGILWHPPRVSLEAFLAGNAAGFGERALRFCGVALATPLSLALGGGDPSTGLRARILALRDMQRDRVEMLTEEYLESSFAPRLNPAGFDLLRKAQHQGY